MSVLITGHSSGFGEALSRKFKEQGKKVYGISRSTTAGNVVDSECECDLENIEKYEKSLFDFCKNLPDLEYVFLNAGTLGELKEAKSLSADGLRKAMEVNVVGHKFLIDTILAAGIKCDNVIAISSGAALSPKYGWLEYCVTKSALKMLMEVYSVENPGTKFLSIAPGLIKTKMQEQIFSTSEKDVPSVSKFHKLYASMDSPNKVAAKFVDFLENIGYMTTGEFADMRNYEPPVTLERYRDFIAKEEAKVLAIDFDGVIHDCSLGLHDGTLYGSPILGAPESIRHLSKYYDIVVYSVRARSDRPAINGKTGSQQVWEWLKKYGVDDCVKDVTSEKPRSLFYLDDKAIGFKSWKQSLEELRDRISARE